MLAELCVNNELYKTITIESISDKVIKGQRLNFDEGVWLFNHNNLTELAALADMARRRHNPDSTVTYIVGRILNYTNVCWVRCKFCAFYRVPGNPEGYTLTEDEIMEKIQQLVDVGGVEVLFQGGLNPKLKLDYYEDIFGKIMTRFPNIILHALSPAEIMYIAHISKLSLKDCLIRLKSAGLQSIPGAGGEILVDRIRNEIAPHKDSTEEWLECMSTAHSLGIKSTASMMYGHIETLEDRAEHLIRVRDLQDETGGFRAFITWSFQPEETDLPIEKKSTGFDYLRTVAVSRLMLDNIQSLQASILTQGPKIAQLSLNYGVNDFGSVMIEENVVSAAGNKFILKSDEIERLISEAGYMPRRRNTRYELIES